MPTKKKDNTNIHIYIYTYICQSIYVYIFPADFPLNQWMFHIYQVKLWGTRHALEWLGENEKKGGWTSTESGALVIPSGKRLHNHGKSQFLMGKSTINVNLQ